MVTDRMKPAALRPLTVLVRASLVAVLVVGLAAGTALAGKGNPGKPGTAAGTINLVMLDGEDATPNYGERVAFDVSTTATDRPFVGVRCYQGATFVMDGYTGYFPTYMFDPWVTLGSPYWDPAVPADCTARLFLYDKRGNQKVLATATFQAQP